MNSPTPKPETVDAALARLNRALESPRTLAQKAIADHYGHTEPTPWINRHDDKGAPTLNVDQSLSRSEPQHAPRYQIQRRRRLLWWR